MRSHAGCYRRTRESPFWWAYTAKSPTLFAKIPKVLLKTPWLYAVNARDFWKKGRTFRENARDNHPKRANFLTSLLPVLLPLRVTVLSRPLSPS